jgi:hypothetical protein
VETLSARFLSRLELIRTQLAEMTVAPRPIVVGIDVVSQVGDLQLVVRVEGDGSFIVSVVTKPLKPSPSLLMSFWPPRRRPASRSARARVELVAPARAEAMLSRREISAVRSHRCNQLELHEERQHQTRSGQDGRRRGDRLRRREARAADPSYSILLNGSVAGAFTGIAIHNARVGK